jgi:hypothetical protein
MGIDDPRVSSVSAYIKMTYDRMVGMGDVLFRPLVAIAAAFLLAFKSANETKIEMFVTKKLPSSPMSSDRKSFLLVALEAVVLICEKNHEFVRSTVDAPHHVR